ncbi:hypothetical protein PG997_009432 [Apiospora hydei]|uniref:Uncharacterized protein n=1 Tax=Apiospora hydei TaxID=1337664 RepID=A0ABR1VU47_9PEZI
MAQQPATFWATSNPRALSATLPFSSSPSLPSGLSRITFLRITEGLSNTVLSNAVQARILVLTVPEGRAQNHSPRGTAVVAKQVAYSGTEREVRHDNDSKQLGTGTGGFLVSLSMAVPKTWMVYRHLHSHDGRTGTYGSLPRLPSLGTGSRP